MSGIGMWRVAIQNANYSGGNPDKPTEAARKITLAYCFYHEYYHAVGFIREGTEGYETYYKYKQSDLIYYLIREEIAAYAFSAAMAAVLYGDKELNMDREAHQFMEPEYRYLILFKEHKRYPEGIQQNIRIAHRAYRMLRVFYYRFIKGAIAEKATYDAW